MRRGGWINGIGSRRCDRVSVNRSDNDNCDFAQYAHTVLVLKHFLFDKVNKVIEDRKMMLRKLTGRLTRQKKMPRSLKLSIQAD